VCASYQDFLNIKLQNQVSSLLSWSRHFEYFTFAFRSWSTHSEYLRHIWSHTHELCGDNPVPFSFVIYQRIINYHRNLKMSSSNNSTSRGRSVYLPEHLLLIIILLGNVLLMHCSHKLDERLQISIYKSRWIFCFFLCKIYHRHDFCCTWQYEQHIGCLIRDIHYIPFESTLFLPRVYWWNRVFHLFSFLWCVVVFVVFVLFLVGLCLVYHTFLWFSIMRI
jgi:hypothetical protein